jgi:hypothetical protein
MNEKEVGRALLRRESDLDAKAIADAVMRRDRRRVWSMTFGCIAAWIFVVALAWATILPMVAKVVENQLHASEIARLTPAEQNQHLLDTLRAFKQGTVATALGSVCSILLAAICTVRLITFSRTSTLRQVNARLDEISSQVKLIAASLPKGS